MNKEMIKRIEKDIDEWVNSDIKNQCCSFTYGNYLYELIAKDNFNDMEVRKKLKTQVEEHFDTYYLESLEDSRLKKRLLSSDAKLYVEILDVAELQELMESILGDSDD